MERRCESDGGGTAAALALCGVAAPAPPPPPPPPLCALLPPPPPPPYSFLTGNCEETPRGSPMPVMARLSCAWSGLGLGSGLARLGCAMSRPLELRKRSISMS
eukprot:scaffold102018_cov48-Phaeocystis_antarctica.AAC.2